MSDAPVPLGQIVTFYSFKGGTGRTMALANVAWILAANGRRVLVVDWDLESPGLHHYFRPFLTDPKLRHSRGVIDIIRDFAAAVVDPDLPASEPSWFRAFADVEREAVSLNMRFPDGGSLDLLPAGVQDVAYSQRVSSIDWSDFWERLNGRAFLLAMRDSMRQQYDYVLIDSRTGLSDNAGICTVELPDTVVNCFTLNDQSIDGAVAVAESIRRLRGTDPIRILPVPMRVEAAEQFKLEAGRDYARYRFAGYLPMEPDAVDAYWGDTEIPYKPFFAYEEILAVFGERSRQEYSLLSSYERLTAVITDGLVREFPALDERERRRRLGQYERQKQLLTHDVVISYASVNRAWTDWIANEFELIGLRVTLREVDLAAGATFGDPALESWLDPTARVLVLLSRDYVGSPNAAALWEALVAKDPTGGMLVPIRLDASRLPVPFADRVAVIDLVNVTEERARQALAAVFDEVPAPAGGYRTPSLRAPRFPGDQPPVWDVPQRNATFTGRSELLETLRDRLSADRTVVMPQALYGLGGVGKTQVALEYAHRFAANYDIVWWISAQQPSMIRTSLADLAGRLDLPAGADVSATVDLVLEALRRGEPYQRWLLIYDNADDPADVEPYLPQGQGHVLLTSRNLAWSRQATVEVGVFTRPESVTLLRRRVPSLSIAQADSLAERLGDLPLAVEQAGAWLAATGTMVDDYLRLLDTHLAEVLSDSPPHGYERPVAITWRLSLERIRQHMPAAAKLLEVCAFFAAEPIPTSLFYNERFIELLLPLDPLLSEPLVQGRLINEISRYALARVDSGQSTIQLHRLVQAVIRAGLPPAEQEANLRHVHDVLAAVNPKDPDDAAHWPAYRRLHQHVMAAGVLSSPVPAVRQLVIDMVRYLWKVGDYHSGQEFGEAALAQWRLASGGADDITTLSLRLHLGNTTRSLARYEEAYLNDDQVYRELAERVGADHPYTIMAMSSLTADLRVKGQYEQAHDLDKQALEQSIRVLGEEHPRTTNAMNNLARSLGLVGDFRAAVELEERAWEIRVRTNGERHPSTLLYALNLARDYLDLGRYERARELLTSLRQVCGEVLGERHSQTIRASRTLAVALRKLGEVHSAHALTVETLPKFERVLGPTHLDTLACTSNLACDQSAIGDDGAARRTAEGALASYRATVGDDHTFSLSCENNLAIFLRRLGEHRAALRLTQRVGERFTSTLGADHPYTLAGRINQSNVLFDLGEHAEALRVDRDVWERIRGALGPDHPDVLAAGNNLAISLRVGGAAQESAELLRGVRTQMERTLGPDHHNVVLVRKGVRINCDIDPRQL
ncbi:FxSxx-COOH system tetratricopeptide repeat protein [Micromonospora sp. NBC_01813]|uniref:FxSxx-COOH system tetratricopeptide repeat protein n=1 Tax=Micromonospora sp. NBC_01813 TaxID=2975988 RepID=UPI002DD8ACF9|nr:FxSxx-COOH system tetratricopeptide repeat protein [Micromonospora sp. NBC_01813]WSA06876.1 FxSxx-COOH system tetratricopeptide repeat protein [Micromonospora sp. NBC_01813]